MGDKAQDRDEQDGTNADWRDAPRTDIREHHWTLKLTPIPWHPYLKLARLDRPIGTWLLLLPCWWGLALGSSGLPNLWFALLFALGAIAMRGAGCTINDLADRDLDAKVERTALRPLPSGQVTPKQALAFMVFLLLIGLGVLILLPSETWLIALLSMGLVIPYPLMKRITYWPQAWLGLTFNWGALVGYTAAMGELQAPALILYAAGFFWTLGYDTIYAHQDRADDLLIGVRSSAIALGDKTRPAVAVFYVLTLGLIWLAGHQAGMGMVFNAGLMLAGTQLLWQVLSMKIDDPGDCLKKFKSNTLFGLAVTVALVADSVLGASLP